MSETLDLSCELIRRASVSPADAGCQEILIARLEKLGFSVRKMPFGPVDNFFAIRGNAVPVFCFAGHTDVVPPGPDSDWQSPPYEPEIRDGYLYGRGAGDMKGALAAMITATEAFIEKNPSHPGSIAFLITSDEEGDATHGTRKVVEQLRQEGQVIDWCLIGEPSSLNHFGDTIRIGRRGSLSGSVTIKGIQGHVAYPELADNPIHRFAPAMTELCKRIWDTGNESFPPTSFQISNIRAGAGANNVIPGELVADFNFRFSTESSAAQLQHQVETMLTNHGCDFSINWHLSGIPFLTPWGKLSAGVTSAVQGIVGMRPQTSTGGGTSDGRFISTMGAEVVEFGLCNGTIHKIDECTAVEDLDWLKMIYERTLALMLGDGGYLPREE